MQAQDQLHAAAHHLLDQEALRPHAGVRLDLGGHALEAGADLLGAQADGNAAHVALVRDLAGKNLQHRGAAQLARGLLRLLRIGHHDLACARHAETREELLGLLFVQRSAGHVVHVRQGSIHGLRARCGPACVRMHRGESAGAAFGRHECGHAALVELARDAGRMRAHVHQQGLVAAGQAVVDRIGHQLRHGQAGGADDHDRRVVGRTGEQRADRAAQQLGLQAGERNVDRVAVQHGLLAGLQRAQGRGRLCIGRRRLEARAAEAVGDQRAGAAGRGQHRHASPAWRAPGRERGRNVEQVGEGLGADHAQLAEQCVVHAVRARQRTGVRHGRACACLGAADLEDHHRLALARRLQRRGAEFVRMAQPLHVERDDRGGLVVRQVVHEIGQVQVDLVAGGNQLRQPDAARRGTREQGTEDAAALRDHADGTGLEAFHFQRAGRREGDAVGEVDQPDGVGPQDAHAARGLQQLPLPPCAFLADLRVAAGQHDGGGGAALGQRTHGLVRALRAQQHDAHVRCLGQRFHVGVALQTADLGSTRVHRVDGAIEAMPLKVCDRATRGLRRIGRSADHRHAARLEQARDGVVSAHAGFPLPASRNASTASRCSCVV